MDSAPNNIEYKDAGKVLPGAVNVFEKGISNKELIDLIKNREQKFVNMMENVDTSGIDKGLSEVELEPSKIKLKNVIRRLKDSAAVSRAKAEAKILNNQNTKTEQADYYSENSENIQDKIETPQEKYYKEDAGIQNRPESKVFFKNIGSKIQQKFDNLNNFVNRIHNTYVDPVDRKIENFVREKGSKLISYLGGAIENFRNSQAEAKKSYFVEMNNRRLTRFINKNPEKFAQIKTFENKTKTLDALYQNFPEANDSESVIDAPPVTGEENVSVESEKSAPLNIENTNQPLIPENIPVKIVENKMTEEKPNEKVEALKNERDNLIAKIMTEYATKIAEAEKTQKNEPVLTTNPRLEEFADDVASMGNYNEDAFKNMMTQANAQVEDMSNNQEA